MKTRDAHPERRRRPIRGVILLVVRMVGAAAGLAMMVLGVPLFFLPIPLGIPLFLLGLILIAACSKTAHEIIIAFLQRYPVVWRRVRFAFAPSRGPAE